MICMTDTKAIDSLINLAGTVVVAGVVTNLANKIETKKKKKGKNLYGL